MTLSFWKVMFSAQEVLDLADECGSLLEFEEQFTELAEARSRREPEPDPIRDILVAVCRRDGIPLGSSAAPGTPAGNCELASRLGIGRVFGLEDDRHPRDRTGSSGRCGEPRDLRPRCPGDCGCRLGTEDADARECGCDGPCTRGHGEKEER